MENWTAAEKQLHERGRSMMQSARDTRRNRIEREEKLKKIRLDAQAAAQQAADKRYEMERDTEVASFMQDFTSLLGKYNLSLVTLQTAAYVGQDLPLFKVVSRGSYKAPEYLIQVRPGRGFNWKK